MWVADQSFSNICLCVKIVRVQSKCRKMCTRTIPNMITFYTVSVTEREVKLSLLKRVIVDETRYKQCGVIPHFSLAQNIFKKISRKD